jgi:hypothetical protein
MPKMQRGKAAIKRRLETIISKLVDVQALMPSDMDLQTATRSIRHTIDKLNR